MNFNLMGLLSQFLNNTPQQQNFGNNIETQSSNNSNNAINSQNISDYPDVFFTQNTKTTSMQNSISQGANNNYVNNNSSFGNFNLSTLSNILPVLFNKSASTNENENMLSMLKNLSPQISQILSIFSKKNKKTNEKNQKSEVQSQNIIDLSDYTEVS